MAKNVRAEVLLGVFAKHWTPGKAKTRLAANLGAERAAEAARLFLQTTLQRLSELSGEHLLAYAPKVEREAFHALLADAPGRWRLEAQPSGSLGDRMRWYFDHAAGGGHPAAILLGADSPDFPTPAIERARKLLADETPPLRLVLAPASDGGYWMLGVRGAPPPIFDRMPWSEGNLLQETLARLEQHGWRQGFDYKLLDTWHDIDTIDDLAALRRRLPPSPEYADLRRFLENLSPFLA